MLTLEKLANATTKNRAEVSKLYMELNRIDKEKRNELRMLNNEKQRFKAKYSKTAFSNDSPIQEASDVKMYETHNPGFCFKRNGEHKVQQIHVCNPPVDFEHLQFLLFTNGEVDIEKILCLHLLSTHETKHLTPPKNRKFRNSLVKKESPYEQLLERSKEQESIASSMILPTYVIDLQKESSFDLEEDSRLTERFLINEKIFELILTVIGALENSNPEKVQHLINLVNDTSSLKRIFRKNHIQEFLLNLKQHSLVSSCSSFILTQPNQLKANHIEIRTVNGALEDLVKFIRENVLQQPNHNTYKEIIYSVPNSSDFKNNVIVKPLPTIIKKIFDPLKMTNESLKHEFKRESKNVEIEETPRFRRSTQNFIAKNIMEAGSYKRFSDDENSQLKSSNRRSADNEKKKKTEDNADAVDNRKLQLNLTDDKKRKLSAKSNNEVKFHLKQTTCPACMEKWKTPLPSPKISNLVKNADISEDDKGRRGSLKTDNKQRLSMLIEREQFRLNAYDRRYSNISNSSNIMQTSRKSSAVQRSSLDLVTLDVYDLEKIRQEIREKEVKKKLQNFLESY